MRTSIVLLSIMICPVLAAHEPKEREDTFYDRKSEGWFFYNEHRESEKLEQQARHLDTKPIAIPAITAEWLRENLPKYKDAAWNNPTLENMRAFLYLT